MSIYEHRATLTVSGGSNNTTTLNVMGGELQQVLVRSNTATTVFRANLEDRKGTARLNYGYHTGEINEVGINYPITGTYTVNITNANPDDDTFTIVLAVNEK